MSDSIGDLDFGDQGPAGNEPAYIASLGRISGKLLSANLLRNGNDLTVRNAATDPDLLYLDVTGKNVGINVENPTHDLEIYGKTYTSQDLILLGSTFKVDNVVLNSNGSITSVSGPIIIEPGGTDPYVTLPKVTNPNLEIFNNYIKVTTLNTGLNLQAHGSGAVDLQHTTNVTGNMKVTGNIGAGGNVNLKGRLTVGDSPVDTVTISPDLTQNIIAGTHNTYDLGSFIKRWRNINITGLPGTSALNTQNVYVSDQLHLTGQRISTMYSNDPLFLDSETGNVFLERLKINGDTITNLNNTAITFVQTGTGYALVDDETAIRIPVGTSAERKFLEVGETRWNTNYQFLECFDGNVYQIATGGGIVITAPIMEELGHLYSLILG
jgi:hypothetical protein